MDVYDPVLGEAELALLRARGCGAPERNEEGRRSVATQEKGLTLFFMPHCGRQLYANVLEANWGPEPLSRCSRSPPTLTLAPTLTRPTTTTTTTRLAILGNSFAAYAYYSYLVITPTRLAILGNSFAAYAEQPLRYLVITPTRLAILGNSFAAYADALTAAQRDRTAGWCRLIARVRVRARATLI
eukprot:scaffold42431_cov53-Phaeocystis_antarctica.AAC.1